MIDLLDRIPAASFWMLVCGMCLACPSCVFGQAQDAEQPVSLYIESGINHSARAVVFSPDGKFAAANGIDRTIRVWRLTDFREILSIPYAQDISSFAFHPTLPLLATHDAYGETVQLWDLKERKLLATDKCGARGWHTITFSVDGTRLLHPSGETQSIQAWDSGLQHRLPDQPIRFAPRLKDLAISQDGRLLAGHDKGGNLRIVDVTNWRELNHLSDTSPEPGAFSLGLTHLGLIRKGSDEIEIWSSIGRKDKMQGPKVFKVQIAHALAFSEDDRMLACAQESGDIVILDASTGKEKGRLSSYSNRVEAAGWIEGSKTLGVQLWYNLTATWPANASQPSFEERIPSVPEQARMLREISPGPAPWITVKKNLDSVELKGERDETIGTLVFLDKKRAWVMTTPDGRFDTNINLDEVSGVHWVVGEDWFDPLPLELFMRDYYTPRLFARVVAQEPLPHVARLSGLNRVQPRLSRPHIKLSAQGKADVTVLVTSQSSTTQKDKAGRYLQSGVFDVRLFRDGQLVGQWPENSSRSTIKTSAAPIQDERTQWRKEHNVALDRNGKATIHFRNIQLPQNKGVGHVTFTAYAFNSDRVKSAASLPLVCALPHHVQNNLPRAYVITMGVNATEASGPWDLSVAVPSAKDASRLWRERLSKNYEVVEISLMSDLNSEGGIARADATKSNLRAVLDMLAGRKQLVSPARLHNIDPERKLRPATPDDAIVLHVVSHGYVDPQGRFFLIPFDTGTERGIDERVLTRCQSNADSSPSCPAAASFLSHAISSDDLAGWWTGVDGGEMVLVLDSCHSGAVPGQGFRPGPLGDRGFGQLAYDKGLRIFAATQPDKVARGTMVQGPATLLVQALDEAAANTATQSISDWLRSAERNLPEQARRLYPTMNEHDIQWPELMDFRREPTHKMQNSGRRQTGHGQDDP